MTQWLNYRDGIRLAHQLTGEKVSIHGQWPAVKALLWQAAHGEIATTAAKWQERRPDGSSITIEDEERRHRFLDVLLRRETGSQWDNIHFTHVDELTGTFTAEFRDSIGSDAKVLYEHFVVRLQFSLTDIHTVFGGSVSTVEPRAASSPSVIASESQERRKPGPSSDPDWSVVVKEVTAECVKAGYSLPLQRGDQARVISLLLSKMNDRNKYPSDDTARRYAKTVIAAFPAKSG